MVINKTVDHGLQLHAASATEVRAVAVAGTRATPRPYRAARPMGRSCQLTRPAPLLQATKARKPRPQHRPLGADEVLPKSAAFLTNPMVVRVEV